MLCMSLSITFFWEERMISDEEKIAQGAARFLCMDCGVDTDKSQEYYMLKLPVWRKINPQIDGMLCL